MPHFVYDGTYGRDFPALGLRLEPGDVIERADNPDPAYFQPIERPITELPLAEVEEVA